MPRFLRIQNSMIHVPSLFNVNMGTSWFGYPFLRLSFHTKQEIKITYDKWEPCERDLHRLIIALKEVETALDGIVLTEETIVLSLPSPSSSSCKPPASVSISNDSIAVEPANTN